MLTMTIFIACIGLRYVRITTVSASPGVGLRDQEFVSSLMVRVSFRFHA